jgi:glycosyltransferase involved in cell wall biosynthesis
MLNLVQMNPRRRFLTAKALRNLGKLKSLTIHGSSIPGKRRVLHLILRGLAYNVAREAFEVGYDIRDKEIDLQIIEPGPLQLFRKLLSNRTYKYNMGEIINFGTTVSKRIPLNEDVYAYSGCAEELFIGRSGLRILDQTSLLPADEVELFLKSGNTVPNSSWIEYMKFLQARNLSEIWNADLVLCLYPQIEESVKKWQPKANTKLIAHPCDRPKLKSFTPNDRPVFVFAGQKSYIKGLSLIDRWVTTSRKAKEVDIIICGPEGNFDTTVLRKTKNIHVLGMQSRKELSILLKKADLCIFPEQQNALGNTAFEAMECGTPVISRANLVISNGFNGFTFIDDNDFLVTMDKMASKTSADFYEVGQRAILIAEDRHNRYSGELNSVLQTLR